MTYVKQELLAADSKTGKNWCAGTCAKIIKIRENEKTDDDKSKIQVSENCVTTVFKSTYSTLVEWLKQTITVREGSVSIPVRVSKLFFPYIRWMP